ncbi:MULTISPECIES: sugar phosphate isomerase/epimerase family protein [Thermodesulfovibrio]|jgi:sugar phosphate isomerase/epimerase|uniref:sugar phosphate isomerase/epimerase family protein n=1 Tax=Thermodesulfovibrio TaxID=28261 RepID=UPI002610EDA5|nr:sugar phosphate isomerase/epimerase family protein [Thermodesulfovibrio sp.]
MIIKPHVHIPYRKFYDYIDIIQREKLNLEIYFDGVSLDEIDKKAILRLKDSLSYNPFLSFHGPFLDLSPGAVDPRVRDITIERFNQVLDIAEILYPKCIVFHSGYDKWKYAFKVNIWLEQSLFTWERILKKAESLKIKIAIENIFEEEPESLKLLMDKFSSPFFGICFDTGHFNLFSKKALEEWISTLGPFIFEFHLHDNNGGFDEHLSIGSGSFDFKKLFSLFDKRDYVYTIEAHNAEEVFKSIKKFNELINLD